MELDLPPVGMAFSLLMILRSVCLTERGRAVDVFLVLGPDFGLGMSGGAPSVGKTALGPKVEARETPQEVWGLG